ncbi:uncharacterized protein ARB_04176 [Trichophyton benhamiae CBS 112371]|uniref:Uncharacterized protein n=1 Tax=Arthroderma benhamiae (strain ATCC MYA-4681 / CBS 112371) TaxID=663331 RepID=D4AIS8_ARTBC|nr:uncharacterized protein ARB_04176 [Trichophyton benhamiae CBS 112371]EFE36651.1 hypothetical protein ARB_04176 [Trichophyton benhamiae CBS 112371]
MADGEVGGVQPAGRLLVQARAGGELLLERAGGHQVDEEAWPHADVDVGDARAAAAVGAAARRGGHGGGHQQDAQLHLSCLFLVSGYLSGISLVLMSGYPVLSGICLYLCEQRRPI